MTAPLVAVDGAMMKPVLQSSLPFAPWMDPRTSRLPGMLPVEGEDWLRVDDAFAGQMAERDRLISDAPDQVVAMRSGAGGAAQELFHKVLDRVLRLPGYARMGERIRRPDGVIVPLNADDPLHTLGRLVQEDLCILQKDASGEHVLDAAVLCFPASWTLSQKIGRGLVGIHDPVKPYDAGIAARVQRLFDAIRPEQPLWRANSLIYDDPTLHQPRPEGVRRPPPVRMLYARSERQCLLRLPVSGAVVFAIHTYVVRITDLQPAERAGLLELAKA